MVKPMHREVLSGGDLPKLLGHYSPVVKVGSLLFLSAQTGVDQATGKVPEGGFEAECRQVFVNIANVLAACGSGLENIVRASVLYTSLDDLPTINAVFAEALPKDPPARTAAIVGLAGGRRISIEVTAVLPT